MFLGIDNAADSDDMFDSEAHLYTWQQQKMSGDELVDRYVELFYKWGNQLVFEDPFAAPRHQWQFWQKLTERMGDRLLIIGDDVLVTNPSIAYDALKEGVCNAGLVKLNQVGSFSQPGCTWRYSTARNEHGHIAPLHSARHATRPARGHSDPGGFLPAKGQGRSRQARRRLPGQQSRTLLLHAEVGRGLEDRRVHHAGSRL